MPSVSQKQARFFRAEYARRKKGKATKTGMSLQKLREFLKVKK